MKTRIIVDSTADLMPDIKKRVHIVPLTLRFGEESRRECSCNYCLVQSVRYLSECCHRCRGV